jgi:hypothetical protein
MKQLRFCAIAIGAQGKIAKRRIINARVASYPNRWHDGVAEVMVTSSAAFALNLVAWIESWSVGSAESSITRTVQSCPQEKEYGYI